MLFKNYPAFKTNRYCSQKYTIKNKKQANVATFKKHLTGRKVENTLLKNIAKIFKGRNLDYQSAYIKGLF